MLIRRHLKSTPVLTPSLENVTATHCHIPVNCLCVCTRTCGRQPARRGRMRWDTVTTSCSRMGLVYLHSVQRVTHCHATRSCVHARGKAASGTQHNTMGCALNRPRAAVRAALCLSIQQLHPTKTNMARMHSRNLIYVRIRKHLRAYTVIAPC